jgi:Kelch motif
VVNGPGPGGRFSHTATVAGNMLFVFGGQIGEKVFNDMWVLHLNSRMFTHRFSSHFDSISLR